MIFILNGVTTSGSGAAGPGRQQPNLFRHWAGTWASRRLRRRRRGGDYYREHGDAHERQRRDDFGSPLAAANETFAITATGPSTFTSNGTNPAAAGSATRRDLRCVTDFSNAIVAYGVDSGPSSAELFDTNQDGILHPVTANMTASSFTLMLGNGDGTSRTPFQTTLTHRDHQGRRGRRQRRWHPRCDHHQQQRQQRGDASHGHARARRRRLRNADHFSPLASGNMCSLTSIAVAALTATTGPTSS